MSVRSFALSVTATLGVGSAAMACEPSVVVAPGDTLFSIAEDQLGDLSRWSLIFYNNPDIQGGSLLDLPAGTVLSIPCPNVAAQPAAPAPVVQADPKPLQQEAEAEIKLVTASNYAPFTDLDWPGQGMLTELVNAAFEATPNPLTYSIEWENDWSKHLFPMLDSKEFDMGFPWFKPDCAGNPSNERCANFHFSDPLVDLVILLFAHGDNPFTFDQDSDLHGKTLCRPAGYFTHDLDRSDRRWLSEGLVTLKQPATPDDCFNMLVAGEVDAVALNEFLGVQKMFEMDLTDRVAPLSRPVSVEGLHVLISKKHWRGTAHLYRFNAGLARLKQSDRYNEIVSRHLALFWDQIKS
ncbi:transporter substrate-binding domain-containing protein [Tateyamaria sp. ANG-S1]|uniref:transporter substrate-binding domain-containing protein n=1 Tax=Tateyamaria sp. ANG-S1 TaxID=1577905 RepID=UPI00057CE905|nr:transporter substrate-binding domain-containing protein [Tateyamaria sp. ANG-S1]KIC50745.1 ABC transporter substrate-binding protein [Tateyamaria sp. ANG-S1]